MKALSLLFVVVAVLVQHAPRDASAISGGKMALPGQFPYQALIQPLDVNTGKATSFCSGVLIDSHWVLTAASCLSKDSDFHQVTLGAFDLTLKVEATRLTYMVATKTVHEAYNPDTRENDLALLKLEIPATLNDFIAPIRLPSKQHVNKSFLMYEGSVTGWGFTSKADSTLGNWVLRWFDSRVEPNFWCRLRNGAALVRDDSVCLSSIWKKGTCLGDAGSPVVITEWDGKQTVLGIASDDAVSCGSHNPPVFTRVTAFLDWIAAATGVEMRE